MSIMDEILPAAIKCPYCFFTTRSTLVLDDHKRMMHPEEYNGTKNV